MLGCAVDDRAANGNPSAGVPLGATACGMPRVQREPDACDTLSSVPPYYVPWLASGRLAACSGGNGAYVLEWRLRSSCPSRAYPSVLLWPRRQMGRDDAHSVLVVASHTSDCVNDTPERVSVLVTSPKPRYAHLLLLPATWGDELEKDIEGAPGWCVTTLLALFECPASCGIVRQMATTRRLLGMLLALAIYMAKMEGDGKDATGVLDDVAHPLASLVSTWRERQNWKAELQWAVDVWMRCSEGRPTPEANATSVVADLVCPMDAQLARIEQEVDGFFRSLTPSPMEQDCPALEAEYMHRRLELMHSFQTWCNVGTYAMLREALQKDEVELGLRRLVSE